MAAPQNPTGSDHPNGAAEFAQAFKEIQRGESAATAVEKHLDKLEKQITELLASAERNHQTSKEEVDQVEELKSCDETKPVDQKST